MSDDYQRIEIITCTERWRRWTTAEKLRIVELALAHPAYGCSRYEALLALEGRRVSAITIQKILGGKELGTRWQRWLALEKELAEQRIELTAEQTRFLEKLNPCHKERQIESGRPGASCSPQTPSWSAP